MMTMLLSSFNGRWLESRDLLQSIYVISGLTCSLCHRALPCRRLEVCAIPVKFCYQQGWVSLESWYRLASLRL